jgi:ribosomal protein S18 acetylase RimI-like enzyme
MSALDRAVAFERAFDERRAERTVRAQHGKAILTPSLPLVYHRNHFSVDLGADASAADLIEEAEPIFVEAGLAHRKITIDDELGERLAAEFQERGWRVEELLVMPHSRAEPAVDTAAVEEVSGAELEPLWIEGMHATPEIHGEEAIRQLVAAQHGRRSAVEVRYFAARSEGEIGSYCELFLEGGIGQIESVMTLERFRGRGLAKAVVSRALAESKAAGHDLTFLVASEADWPKELYRSLGFEAAGSVWDFLRTRDVA